MALANELISQILRRLDELDPDAPVHRSRAEILVFVNEAISELNLIAWEFQDADDVAINSSDNVYDCPSSILAAVAIRVSNYLRRQSVADLDFDAEWESSTEKRLNVRSWSPLGLNKFAIHPRPLGASTATVEGIIEHTPVTDTATALPVRSEYESAIEESCVERAAYKDGPSKLEQAGRHYKNFLDIVQQSSGRNVIRMYPRYSSGVIGDDNLREEVDSGVKQNGN